MLIHKVIEYIPYKLNHTNILIKGKCYFPYLSDWNSLSTLTGFIMNMRKIFSEWPPLYLPQQNINNTNHINPKLSTSPNIINQPQIPQPQMSNNFNNNTNQIIISNNDNLPNNNTNIQTDNNSTFNEELQKDECIVCFTNKKNAVLIPCGHMALVKLSFQNIIFL
eukprot:TRINITY_DN3836_c0_g1_i1.p1 TRINITY_DN3836_c0_g1~~TRINITY_DN3836_c0_g1_i1.p1  ORF type:complete len:165 (-),score=28.77 TRINITY_DN3836_c0_g1_i1:162-656(-)